MAVELRCPECQAKLRLASEPWPGTDVECPKCGTVFPAPDPRGGDAPPAKKSKPADERPTKKAPADQDEDDADEPAQPAAEEKKPEKKEEKKPEKKKRRIKKKESNPTILIFAGIFALMVVGTVVAVLVWFFGRQPSAFELMKYLPEDSQMAVGANISHLQRYPKLFEKIDEAAKGVGYHLAADAVATAAGSKANDMLDYVVWGEGASGSALVLRMKPGVTVPDLAKLPGAVARKTSSGAQYYEVNHYDPRRGGARLRAFSPSDRVVVFADTSSDAVFQKMMNGNADADDKVISARSGALGKRVVRGTYWVMVILKDNDPLKKEPPDTKGGNEDAGGASKRFLAKQLSASTGLGCKVTVGSRAVKIELVIQEKDSDTTSKEYTKFKTEVIDKAEEDEPKWWKENRYSFGGAKAARELWSNIAAKTSGELFIIYSQADTVNVLEGVGSLVQLATATQQGGAMSMGAPPGGAPGGMAPPGGPPGGMVPPGAPPGGMMPGGPPKGP